MIMTMKPHEILNSLFKRSGYSSYKKLAKDMGLADASSVQRYFKDGWSKRKKFFPPELVAGFEEAFVGKGTPPITKEEVWKMGSPYPVNLPVNHSSSSLINNVGDLWELYKGADIDIQEEFDSLHAAYIKKRGKTSTASGAKARIPNRNNGTA